MEINEALCKIVSIYGKKIYFDTKRLKGLLLDYGIAKKNILQILVSLETGRMREFIDLAPMQLDNVIYNTILNNICEDTGYDEIAISSIISHIFNSLEIDINLTLKIDIQCQKKYSVDYPRKNTNPISVTDTLKQHEAKYKLFENKLTSVTKLVLAIIHNEDAPLAVKKLYEEDLYLTELASEGGFLLDSNTTLLIGTNEDSIPKIVDILENKCKHRIVDATHINSRKGYLPGPSYVYVDGATIFILDIEEFKKVVKSF